MSTTTGQGSSGKPIIVVVALLVMVTGARAEEGSPPTASDLLHALRAYDEVYRSGLTATGRFDCIQSPETGGQRVPVEFRLMWSPSALALREVAAGTVAPPEEPSLGKKKGSRLIASQKGTPTVRVRTYTLLHAEGSAQLSAYLGKQKNPRQALELDDTAFNWVLTLYPPKDLSLELWGEKLLWVMGRGYSGHLEKILKVATSPEGMIQCSASGRGPGSMQGKWELLVEPRAGYMVRNAKFFPSRQSSALIEIKNSDPIVKSDRQIPRTGEWGDRFFTDELSTSAVSFESIAAEPDEKLIAEINSRMFGAFSGPTTVNDRRLATWFSKHFRSGETYAQGNSATRPSQ